MGQEFVQNVVMDEEFVKNFVMDAKIDPKIVMDLSLFKIGGWNIVQPQPSRDSFLVIQCLERHSVSAAHEMMHSLQPVTIRMHIQEDTHHRGENLRG